MLRSLEIGSFSRSMKASGIPAQYGDKMFSLVTEDSLCCCAGWKQGVVQVNTGQENNIGQPKTDK